jgi:SAM-dependent methyltransferase
MQQAPVLMRPSKSGMIWHGGIMHRRDHWERVYRTKGEHDVSWFESLPGISLDMLEACGLTHETCVLDVGGGDSRLIDHLAARGMDCLAVLDVSGEALQRAQSRLGDAARVPVWIEADVTGDWNLTPMDIWHDRAVFHFLTTSEDQARYLEHLGSVLKARGSAIIATFAPDGPPTCSGLPVARYSPESLAERLGPRFTLADSRRHVHHTPWGTTQPFQYSRFVRVH